jgi:hypothetical protein
MIRECSASILRSHIATPNQHSRALASVAPTASKKRAPSISHHLTTITITTSEEGGHRWAMIGWLSRRSERQPPGTPARSRQPGGLGASVRHSAH